MTEVLSFRDVLETVTDMVVVTDAPPSNQREPRIVFVNRAFEALTGYDRAEVIGRSPRLLHGPESSREARSELRHGIERRRPARATLVNYTKAKRPYWVEVNLVPLRDASGEVTHFVALERDLTEQKRVQDELYRLATSDGLTGISNRRFFLDRAAIEVDKAKRYERPLGLIAFDIDHFKRLNDRHGHACGDETLAAIAGACAALLRNGDLFGRLGGEEFAIALPETGLASAVDVAERLRRTIAVLRRTWRGAPATVTASFGVAALLPGDTGSLDSLLRRADLAMYDAKATGRNRVGVSSE